MADRQRERQETVESVTQMKDRQTRRQKDRGTDANRGTRRHPEDAIADPDRPTDRDREIYGQIETVTLT